MAPVLKTDVVNSYRGFESLLILKIMKFNIKSKLFGYVSSDGSFNALLIPGYNLQKSLYVKNIDTINHSIWTGRRPKEQTEISAFINRFIKKS